MVDDPIRAGGVHAVAAAGAGRRRHVGSGALGELDRGAPDAAARAVDEDALTVLEPRVLEERLPGGEPCDGERRGVGQLDGAGCGRQELGGRRDVLRVGAGLGRRQERDDRVADAPTVHVIPDLADDAGHVDPRDVRERDRHDLTQDALP